MQEHIARGSPLSLRIFLIKHETEPAASFTSRTRKCWLSGYKACRKVGAEASSEGEIELVQEKETDRVDHVNLAVGNRSRYIYTQCRPCKLPANFSGCAGIVNGHFSFLRICWQSRQLKKVKSKERGVCRQEFRK